METTNRKLLTIVSEAALEETLVRDIEALGARGYTITDARGKGSHGKRDASWTADANIRIEVLCDVRTAHVIGAALRERYYANYSMVMYLSEVEVLRPEKF